MNAGEIVVNDVGDVVLTDPAMITALADEVRYGLFVHLQGKGPRDETSLARELGLELDTVVTHLAELAGVGLATRSRKEWSAPGSGLVVDPVTPETEVAARRLYGVMILATTDLASGWIREQAPLLDPDWFAASGMFNARLALTHQELANVQVELEEVLAPYIARTTEPEDALPVRILAYLMPDAKAR